MTNGDPRDSEDSFSFSAIDRRLKRIEEKLGIISEKAAPAPSAPRAPDSTPSYTPASATPAYTPAPRPAPRPRAEEPASRVTTGLFLGAIAALCILLAAVLMIKLMIDSGWLTPIRQVGITALAGSVLIATNFLPSLRDRRYLSILPGLGVALLNISVYGAAFTHHLIEPGVAYVLVNIVAVLCLALYFVLKEDLYVIYSVIGIHLGTMFLGGAAPNPQMVFALLLVWNLVFARLSVEISSRKLLAVIAYFGFATNYFISVSFRNHPEHSLAMNAGVQAALFLVYLYATIRYTRRYNEPLTEGETWSLFPPLLVFYMTEYSWLTQIVGTATPYIFLGVATILWLAYFEMARRSAKPLASGKLVYLFVSATLLHAFFFQIVPDDLKPMAGLVIGSVLLLFRDRLDFHGNHFGLMILGILTGLGGFILALFGMEGSSTGFQILQGCLYGAALLAFAIRTQNSAGDQALRDFFVVLAHLQWMTALYRARHFLGVDSLSLAVTGTWISYAFVVFAIGWTRRFAWFCRSCLFILTFCILKLMVYDVWNQPPIVRIISLAGLGVSLYAFGYLLRRVAEWDQKPRSTAAAR